MSKVFGGSCFFAKASQNMGVAKKLIARTIQWKFFLKFVFNTFRSFLTMEHFFWTARFRLHHCETRCETATFDIFDLSHAKDPAKGAAKGHKCENFRQRELFPGGEAEADIFS